MKKTIAAPRHVPINGIKIPIDISKITYSPHILLIVFYFEYIIHYYDLLSSFFAQRKTLD